MGRRRKEQASLDTVSVVTYDAVDAAELSFPSSVEEVVVDSVPAEESVTAAPTVSNPTKWVVLEDQVVSLFGQMTTLPAGTIVSIGSYGPIGVKRIMEQGVMMEPLE